MSCTYFKRYRMEIDLRSKQFAPSLPEGYRLVAWTDALLPQHAQAKYDSFRTELDSQLFPCLGSYEGCLQLMRDIAAKRHFMKDATWLAEFCTNEDAPPTLCGTIQGMQLNSRYGGIQNIGVVKAHRGKGIGKCLIEQSLLGFAAAGLRRAMLEVTAQNMAAIEIYEKMGFRRTKTIYKAVEVVWA